MHLFLPQLIIPPRNQCRNNQQSLVCHNQQCKITWRKTWIWSYIAQNSQMNCWTFTWAGTMTHVVHCWTLYRKLHPAERSFFFHWWVHMYCSTHDRNVLPAKENPHFVVELEHNPLHLMLWAGMTATRLSGLCVFDGLINAASCAQILEAWLILHLRDRGLMEDVWLQHNRAPTHFSLTVCNILNEHYLGHWIGCGSPTLPFHYPGRHIVLVLPHQATLWAIIQGQVAVHCYCNSDKLCRAVEQAFTTIMPQMLWHISQNMVAHQAVFCTWHHVQIHLMCNDSCLMVC
jgi:hypothetical protein